MDRSLHTAVWGVVGVDLLLYTQVAQHRADVAVEGWSHMQYWAKVAGLRCNAGIFLSVVTGLVFGFLKGGEKQSPPG